MHMYPVTQVCDYVILKVLEGGEQLNNLKLQKLLYYVQAWGLAHDRGRIFDAKFQAWVHGPVCRAVYDRFLPTKSLYSEITQSDISPGFNPDTINNDDQLFIDSVLEAYVPFSGSQLEDISHREAPWKNAREGLQPAQRSEKEISELDMQNYYKQRLAAN